MKAKNKNSTEAQKKYMPFIIIFVIVIIMEIFLFNWRFFEGSEYEKTALYEFTCGSGVTASEGGELKIASSGDKWIEFIGLDLDIDNIYIDVKDKRNDDAAQQRNGISHSFQSVAVVISVTDEANAQYIELPERVIAQGVERTKYIKMHTAGKSDKLKIKFNGVDNQTLLLNSVAVNKQVPFSLNLTRICFFFVIFVLAYLMRFGSRLYDIKFNVKSSAQNGITAALVAFNIVIAFGTALTNPQFVNTEISFHQQYQRLADAFLNGHIYLDYDNPPQALIDMENPYDTNERSRVMKENGTSARWDHAYFNGKYYVYYGALPVLTYYLPYKAITGEDFPTHMGVLINISLFIIFSFAFMRALVKKLFKNISFINYILLSEVLAASSGIIFGLRKADMYAMPITMGLALTIMGLYFWFTAYNSSKKTIQVIKLGVGSLFMALVAGCRPQLLLGSFLAVPLFWNKVFKERELFSKKAWKETLVFILPYVIVAAAVMWYNYARFGSVFDFGANYNLTTNDMTKRGMNLGRLPFGIFCYFLQLPATLAKFPFITNTNLSNSYMGTTTTEAMFGGIFAVQPVLWVLLLIKSVKNELKEKGIFAFAVCCMVFSLIIACADTEMAGVLYRYYMDYSYFMLIPAAITVLALIEKYDNKGLMFGAASLCGLCMCYNLAALLVSSNLSHEITNPDFYYSIASALTFWM